MTKLLLDANLSPRTSADLQARFGIDVVDLQSLGLASMLDPEIVRLAQQERRVIVTLDLGLGGLFHRAGMGSFGVIVLRLDEQTVESVNRVLDRFFRSEALDVPLERSLVEHDERRFRVSAGH